MERIERNRLMWIMTSFETKTKRNEKKKKIVVMKKREFIKKQVKKFLFKENCQ